MQANGYRGIGFPEWANGMFLPKPLGAEFQSVTIEGEKITAEGESQPYLEVRIFWNVPGLWNEMPMNRVSKGVILQCAIQQTYPGMELIPCPAMYCIDTLPQALCLAVNLFDRFSRIEREDDISATSDLKEILNALEGCGLSELDHILLEKSM